MQTRGFTLVEVLIAMGVLLTAALGGVSLVALSTRAMHVARIQGVTVLAASARLDELRGLQFEFDEAGRRVTDLSTNIAVDPPGPGGGGLTPGGNTDRDVSGFVDYLDATGQWVGTGPAVPRSAVYIRRWAIDAWDGADLVVLRVVVGPVGHADDLSGAPGGTRLATALARVRR